MAILRIPSAGTPLRLSWMLSALLGPFSSRQVVDTFEDHLRAFFHVPYLLLVNSGTTAFYLILKVLKELYPGRDEVIMPAYTAPSLILPIQKARLKARLVDVSCKTFNLELNEIQKAINHKTLLIMPVHMYGIPVAMKQIMKISEDTGIPVVEDAASAMGSKIDGQYVGTLSEIGFFSFNRGKNIATLHGGFIATHKREIADLIAREIVDLPANSLQGEIVTALKNFALGMAVQPIFYTLLYPFISRFKYTTLHTHFDSFQYPVSNARVGLGLLRLLPLIFRKRERNGRFLWESLKNLNGVIVPEIAENQEVVYNQFPLLVKDESMRDKMIEEISSVGVEATRLYPYAVHEVFPEYANGAEEFPNALYFARHLLLIPTHPLISRRRLSMVIQKIHNLLSQ